MSSEVMILLNNATKNNKIGKFMIYQKQAKVWTYAKKYILVLPAAYWNNVFISWKSIYMFGRTSWRGCKVFNGL